MNKSLILAAVLSLLVVSDCNARGSFGGSSSGGRSFSVSRSTSSYSRPAPVVQHTTINKTTVVHQNTGGYGGGSNGLINGMILGTMLSEHNQPVVVQQPAPVIQQVPVEVPQVAQAQPQVIVQQPSEDADHTARNVGLLIFGMIGVGLFFHHRNAKA